MINLLINISGKQLTNSHELKSIFNSLKDGNHQITIADVRKRTLDQNDYYWTVVVPMCRVGLYEVGYDEVKQNLDAHAVLKRVFIKKEKPTTTKLTVVEMTAYLDAIGKWAAEYLNIVIPLPHEAHMKLGEYDSSCEKMVDK